MWRNPFLDLFAALVPAAERDELIRRYDAQPFAWSAVLGILELYFGGKLLLANALVYIQGETDRFASYVVAHLDSQPLDTFEKSLAVTWSGSLVWLAWMLRPMTWLLFSIPLVGIARLVAFGVGHDAVGEPLVWMGLRAAQGMRKLAGIAGRRRRFGPLRPDHVLQERNGGLVVLSCRPKPDWNERITIAIGERFYRLQRVEERHFGAWWVHAHVLQEADPNEIFRGLIRYEPPG